MPLIRDQIQRWDVWCDIFTTLSVLIKKDRDDADGLLINFYPEFRNQIQYAGMDEILRISQSFVPFGLDGNEKKLSYMLANKFCILSVIAIVLRVEQFYHISEDLVDNRQKAIWINFLKFLSGASIIKPRNSKSPPLDNELVKSLMGHFSRFNDVKAQHLIGILSQIELK